MPSNYLTSDPIQGQIDLDDKFITDAWLVDQFVGGTLFAWGSNSRGQLGNGTTINYSSPIQVGSLTNWKQVSSSGRGFRFILSVKTDGTLWACGYNETGQLGNGTVVYYSSPIQVGALTNWKQVSCARAFAHAIKTNGTLWGWGVASAVGYLGDGTSVMKSSPIQIGSLTDWKLISNSGYTGNAIKTDGTLWTWGYNFDGQLGNGTTDNYSSPIQIGSLTNWKQVSGGWQHILAIKTDGTLWAWGRNNFGQLGNGTVNVYYSSPVQIGSLTNWKDVSCGYLHTAAVKTDGTLWSWGRNTNATSSASGQLGNGTTINYSSPIQVGSLTNWKQVSCGYYHTAALKTDGTLWSWGLNQFGRLGDNTTVNYSSPIQIGLLTNWKQVACGYDYSFALTYKDIG